MAVAFALALFGFGALAMAMRRHHRDVFGGNPSVARSAILRALGILLLAASYGVLCRDLGVTEGTIEWLGLISLAAITVVPILTVALLLRVLPARNGVPNPSGIGEPNLPNRRVQP